MLQIRLKLGFYFVSFQPTFLAAFRASAAQQGQGYQTLMNDVLRSHSHEETAPITMEALRAILREIIHEELHPI